MEPARLVPEPVAVIGPLLDSPNLKREATPVRTIATVVRPAPDLTSPMATERAAVPQGPDEHPAKRAAEVV